MRVFFTLSCFTLLLGLSVLQAQRATFTASSTQRSLSSVHNAQRANFDTLFSPTLSLSCSETVFVIESAGEDAFGYVAGTNNFFDKEKAIFLTSAGGGPYRLTGVVAYFFPPDDPAINARELVAFISEATNGGEPGDLIAESEPITVSALNVAEDEVLPTLFTFSEPVEVNANSFFVSIDFTDIYEEDFGDIGLWMTAEGCADDPNPSWELWDDFSWHNIEDADSWGDRREWMLGAVVESLTSSASEVGEAGTSASQLKFAVGPNPASGPVFIEFEQEHAGRLRVELLTRGSTVIKTYELGFLPETGTATLSLDGLPGGLYFMRLISENGVVVKPVVIE